MWIDISLLSRKCIQDLGSIKRGAFQRFGLEFGMGSIINLEESAGETVGRRQMPKDSFDYGMKLQTLGCSLSKAFGNGFVPKGVYRFTSHRQADEWMRKMIVKAAVRKGVN